jgi:hypothetical protein
VAQAAEGKGEDQRPAGNPVAAGTITLVQQEMVAGFRDRKIDPQFAQFCRYLGMKLTTTAAAYTTSEVTGLCRLS